MVKITIWGLGSEAQKNGQPEHGHYGILNQHPAGQAPLERSIGIYERGAALKALCEKRLEEARLRVEKIVMQGGQASAEPAEFN